MLVLGLGIQISFSPSAINCCCDIFVDLTPFCSKNFISWSSMTCFIGFVSTMSAPAEANSINSSCTEFPVTPTIMFWNPYSRTAAAHSIPVFNRIKQIHVIRLKTQEYACSVYARRMTDHVGHCIVQEDDVIIRIQRLLFNHVECDRSIFGHLGCNSFLLQEER